MRTAAGHEIAYDKLVLASGSRPFVPPVPGRDGRGCFVYRTIEDLEAIRDFAAGSSVGTVVGGGLLGLEAANALKNLGLETHVVELAPRLMALQVDDAGGAILRGRIEALGVAVHTGKVTKEVRLDDGQVAGLLFADGGFLPSDMVVFSAGIRARDELAREAGLGIGQRGGVVIDDRCRSSRPRHPGHRRGGGPQRADLRPGGARLPDGRGGGAAAAGSGGPRASRARSSAPS